MDLVRALLRSTGAHVDWSMTVSDEYPWIGVDCQQGGRVIHYLARSVRLHWGFAQTREWFMHLVSAVEKERNRWSLQRSAWVTAVVMCNANCRVT